MRQSNQIFVAVLVVFLCASLMAATHTVTTNADSGTGSLRDIIENYAGIGDTIVFVPGIDKIVFTSGVLANDTDAGSVLTYFPLEDDWQYAPGIVPVLSINNLTIDGGDGVVLTTNGLGRIFNINHGSAGVSQITLKNLTFSDNPGERNTGGAIQVFEYRMTNPLTIISENLIFDSNSGGAIDMNGAGNPLTIINTGTLVFSNNGTGIIAQHVTITGDEATFINNRGRAINAVNVSLGNRATFTGNSGGSGGAIYSSRFTIGDFATFTNNSSGGGSGGAIFSENTTSNNTLGNNSTFSNNSSGRAGGAVAVENNMSFGNGALFKENRSRGGHDNPDFGGGALLAFDSGISLSGNTFFIGNLANQNGGAIATVGQAMLDTTDGNIAFSGNKSGVTFTENSPGIFIPSGGVANSIYGGSLNCTGNNHIYFDDPISGSNSLVKSGTGFVQFLGDNRLTTTGFSGTNSVDIQAGTFRLANNATFDATGAGNFNVATGASLAGQGTITAEGFTISGTVSPDSDRFMIPTFLAKGDPGTTATNYNYFLNDKPTTVSEAKHTGTLTLVGDTTFNNATLAIDLGANNDSDRIAVTGTVISAGTNTVTLQAWENGTFTLLTATGGGINLLDFDIDPSSYGSRQTATLGGTANALTLATSSTNLDLTWTGASGTWDTTSAGNWQETGAGAETYNPNDTVLFTSAAANQDITIAGNAQVSGMQITGGDYTFSGGSIHGVAPTSTGQTVTGKLEVTGGSAAFNNAIDFVNGIVINGGNASFNNTVTAPNINVLAGTLEGTGMLNGAVTFGNGAILSPGNNSIGTLTVNGDVHFNAGSTYQYEIDKAGATHDLLVVNGGEIEILQGAKLDIVFLNGAEEEGDKFQVIAATQGQFKNTTLFDVSNTWTVAFSQKILNDGYWIFWGLTDPDFADNILPYATSNAYNVAMGMDKIYADGLTGSISDLYDALSNMSSSDPKGLADAFAQLHGEVFAASQMNLVNMQRGFLNRLPNAQYRLWNDRNGIFLGQSPCDPCGGVPAKWNRWGTFSGDWLERKSVGSYSGYNLRGAGVVAGIDRNISRNSFGGVAFAYDNANQNFKTIRSNNQIDAFRTVFYGGVKNGKAYADGYVGYTKNWNKTRRDINIGTFEGTARSKFDDDMFSTGFELGRKLSFGNGRVTPSIGLHYINLSSPKVTESGAGDANLLVHSGSYNSLRLPIGVKLSQDNVGYGGIVWTPEARMFYIRELADASVRTGTSFAAVSSVPFYAESGNWGRNSARLGVGLNAALSDWLNFRIDYDYEVYDHTTANWFGTTLGVRW